MLFHLLLFLELFFFFGSKITNNRSKDLTVEFIIQNLKGKIISNFNDKIVMFNMEPRLLESETLNFSPSSCSILGEFPLVINILSSFPFRMDVILTY